MLRLIPPITTLLTTVVLTARLGVAAAPEHQPPDSASTGTVVGRVRLTTRVKGAALPSTAYPTRSVGSLDTYTIPEIRNVVVYVKDAAFRGPLAATRAEMRQEHETFVPHVIAIARGSTVDFPNADPIFHNVFSLSSAASFDLRRYPSGQSRGWQFTKPGIVKVYCHIHSHMSATILVLDHPYFTIPEVDGTFTLANLPPGEHTLVGWHERVGERRATVTIERGKTSTVDLSLPVAEPQ